MSELNLVLLGPPGAGQGHPGRAAGRRLRPALLRDRGHPARGGEGGDRARQGGEGVHGRRRPRAGRADLQGDRWSGSTPARPTTASCSTASRAPIGQAEVLEEALERARPVAHGGVLIDAPDEEVVRRLSGRRICVKNEHVYHVEFDPPKNEGVCDQDGSRLIQRDDDKPETVEEAARGLPRPDRAADRVVRRRGAAAPLRRHPLARRGARPHPCHTGHAASSRTSSDR